MTLTHKYCAAGAQTLAVVAVAARVGLRRTARRPDRFLTVGASALRYSEVARRGGRYGSAVESEKHVRARDWLMKSGYGLEMRAAAACRKHHLFPTQSVHYQDPTHKETTREADVVVLFGNRLVETGDWLTVTAVIECKSPKDKPWAALLEPHGASGGLSAALVASCEADEASLIRLMETWKGFSPFASVHSADALVSVHVSDGQDQRDGHNAAASALRQAMSAASGIHDQYIRQSEEGFHMMTLPVLVTGGELYGASLDPAGDVHVEDLSHVFVKAPRPGGSSVGDVHVMTFDYFTESFVPGLASVQRELIP
jgi:hypothetical protein